MEIGKTGSLGKYDYSEPLRPITDDGKIHQLELPEEPERKPAPKWYHTWFKFWGDNRRICEEYEAAEEKHREWETARDAAAAKQSKAPPGPR